MAAIKANYMTAEEAVKLIKSHDRVYIQGSTSIPEVLLDALTARGHELEGVEMYSAFAVGRRDAPYAVHELRDAFIPRSLFIANCLRNAVARGEAQAIPGFLGQIPGFFREGIIPLDVSLLNVSPPDDEGSLQLWHISRLGRVGCGVLQDTDCASEQANAVFLWRSGDTYLQVGCVRGSR